MSYFGTDSKCLVLILKNSSNRDETIPLERLLAQCFNLVLLTFGQFRDEASFL